MTTTAIDTEQRRPPAPSLTTQDFRLMESVNNHFRAVAPRGTTRERCLENSFWSVVSTSVRPYDMITVIGADRSFHATYLVLEAGLGYVSLIELSWTPLPALLATPDDRLPPNFSIYYGGVEVGWQAKRNSDGVIICSGKSQEECLAALLDHNSVKQAKNGH